MRLWLLDLRPQMSLSYQPLMIGEHVALILHQCSIWQDNGEKPALVPRNVLPRKLFPLLLILRTWNSYGEPEFLSKSFFLTNLLVTLLTRIACMITWIRILFRALVRCGDVM